MILPVMSTLNIKNITLREKYVHAKFHARICSMVMIYCIIKRVSRHVEVVQMRTFIIHLLALSVVKDSESSETAALRSTYDLSRYPEECSEY